MPSELRPLCELVLAARSVQVPADLEVVLLQLALLLELLGRRAGEGIV